MAQLDTSPIASIAQNQYDPAAAQAKGFKLADLIDQSQLSKLQLGREKQAAADDAAVKDYMTKEGDIGTPEKAYKTAQGLSKLGYTKAAMDLLSKTQEREKSGLEIQDAQLKLAETKQGVIVDAIDPVVAQLEDMKEKGATPAMLDAKAQQLAQPAIQQLLKDHPDLAPMIQAKLKDPNLMTYAGLKAAEGQSKKGRDELAARRAQMGAELKEKHESAYESNMANLEHSRDVRDQQLLAKAQADKEGRSPLDEPTLDLAVPLVMADPVAMRQFASYGKAGQARRDQINGAIADKLKEGGLNANDLVKFRATAKGEATSINKMEQQKNAIESFEALAKANGQRVLDLLEKIDDTGVPMIEGARRAGARKLGGVDEAEFKSVLTTFVTEVSRAITNPNMTGVLSDASREEFMKIAPDSMTTAQGKRIINRLFTEMDLRSTFIDQQIDKAKGGLTTPGSAPAAAPAPAAATPGAAPATSGWGKASVINP